MKAEYILKWTTAAMGHLKVGENGNAMEILNELKADAEAEIRRNAAKASGNADRQKAAERILKAAKLTHGEMLWKAWDEGGKQSLCSGYHGAKLNDFLPLEMHGENDQHMDLEKVFCGIRENCGEHLSLPDVATLRAHIKAEKAIKAAVKSKSKGKKRVPYDFGSVLVDAEYLLDILELLPESTAIASKRLPETGTIYFSSPLGEGALCPINRREYQ